MTQNQRENLFFFLSMLGVVWWGFWFMLAIYMHKPLELNHQLPIESKPQQRSVDYLPEGHMPQGYPVPYYVIEIKPDGSWLLRGGYDGHSSFTVNKDGTVTRTYNIYVPKEEGK